MTTFTTTVYNLYIYIYIYVYELFEKLNAISGVLCTQRSNMKT